MTPKTKKVYKVTQQIPRGKVATYGMIARLSGVNSPRAVGTMLHVNPDWRVTPCHRVVNAQGKLADSFGGGGPRVHAARLKKEGVEVVGNKVDLSRFLWDPPKKRLV